MAAADRGAGPVCGVGAAAPDLVASPRVTGAREFARASELTSSRTLSEAMRADVIIAGGGLGGACAALWLARLGRSVLVLDDGRPGAATAAGAGLVNPFTGRRARAAWRHTEALAALHATLDAAGAQALFRPTGVLRPARDARQADAFAATAAAHPDEAVWLGPEATRERAPDVEAAHGALWIPDGGAVALPAAAAAALDAARARGAEVRSNAALAGWRSLGDGVLAITGTGKPVEAARLLLALGDGFGRLPALAALPLVRVKGQTVRLRRPPALAADFPALAGEVYIVPDEDTLVVGATFEHAFADVAPSEAASAALVEKAARLVPALAGGGVTEVRAGVRVGVAGTRLPLVGPLPGAPRVWAFTGFGAKGLLTAPLLARGLAAWLDEPALIPLEVRVAGA